MTEYRKMLDAAYATSRETQKALHALYMADTSNQLMWDMFQAQVEKTNRLSMAIVADIAKSWELA